VGLRPGCRATAAAMAEKPDLTLDDLVTELAERHGISVFQIQECQRQSKSGPKGSAKWGLMPDGAGSYV
jgi:hypothetical protein